jgi:hypothetical protein
MTASDDLQELLTVEAALRQEAIGVPVRLVLVGRSGAPQSRKEQTGSGTNRVAWPT